MWRVCLLSFLMLSACVERGEIVVSPEADSAAHVIPVLVASNRQLTEGNEPTRNWSPNTTYSRYDVSVPPDREPGQIQWAGDPPDPSTDFVTTRALKYRDSSVFLADLRRELAKLPAGRRDVVVFTHGYNMNFAEGTYRLAQMVHDYGFTIVPVFFSWPSAESVFGYVHDRDSLLYSRQALEDLLRLIDQAGAEGVTLLTHSLGGFLAAETIRQIDLRDPGALPGLIQNLVMFSPDIDMDLFVSQMAGISALPSPFVVFASEHDRALQLSSKLGGDKPRLGAQPSLAQLSDLDIILIDITAFENNPGDAMGHFSNATSPELIEIISQAAALNQSLGNTIASNPGVLSSSVLNVRNATEVVMTPSSQ